MRNVIGSFLLFCILVTKVTGDCPKLTGSDTGSYNLDLLNRSGTRHKVSDVVNVTEFVEIDGLFFFREFKTVYEDSVFRLNLCGNLTSCGGKKHLPFTSPVQNNVGSSMWFRFGLS